MKNNIQESYCSFEVSKLLKEKGFDIQGDKVYGQVFENTFRLVNISFTKMDEESGFKDAPYFNAPTHALAIEWIRVNFGICIYVGCKEKEDGSGDVWYIPCGRNLPLKKNGQFIIDTIPYLPKETPQEATEAALLYTLQNLIP